MEKVSNKKNSKRSIIDMNNFYTTNIRYDRKMKLYIIDIFYINDKFAIKLPKMNKLDIGQSIQFGKKKCYLYRLQNTKDNNTLLETIRDIEKYIITSILKFDKSIFGTISDNELLKTIINMYEPTHNDINNYYTFYSPTSLFKKESINSSVVNNSKIVLKSLIIEDHRYFFFWELYLE